MSKIKNFVNKSCSANLVFLKINHFQEDYVVFSPPKLTLNIENALFLSARHSFYLQDIKVSFEYVDFYAKILLVKYTRVKNSTIQRTIISIKHSSATGDFFEEWNEITLQTHIRKFEELTT